ncbi:MAG TPA: sigma-70 family RNA polymerase sigma factor [Candidatus Paceibacterota bacterium]|nr:sigma-70 family RNA polymerase sigma factor [Candidatus Paceibacterota bacterium]
MNTEDIQLVSLAKQNPKEYEKLYTKYSDKVFNYFWYRTGHDKPLSEDLMQETFLRAFQHLKRFNNRGYSYLTYLITIAHNVLVDHYRKPKSIPFEAIEDIPFEITEDLERKSDAESLWRAIQDLPQSNRDKLLMKYQQDMSVRDIATATGTTENAVKLSLSRTRKKLKDHPYVKDIVGFADTKRKQTRARFLDKK